jgi:hypothetical protein
MQGPQQSGAPCNRLRIPAEQTGQCFGWGHVPNPDGSR